MGVRGLEMFISATEAFVQDTKNVVFEDQVRVAEFMLERLIDYSPAITGAYRASHAVFEGATGPSLEIWSADNRPARNPGGHRELISPPTTAGVAERIRAVAAPFSSLWLLNDVLPFDPNSDTSYASNVEFGGRWGNSFVPGHLVYGRAFHDAVNFAEDLALTANDRVRKS